MKCPDSCIRLLSHSIYIYIAVPKSPEPLDSSKRSMFESRSSSETGSESKRSEYHSDKKGQTHNAEQHRPLKAQGRRVPSPPHSVRTAVSPSARGAGREHGKQKGNGKKRDS